VFLELKTKSAANETNLLESKERNIIANLLEFAISETTFCYRHNIAIENSSNLISTKFKNLSIALIVLDCKKSNVDRRALLF